jgi:cyclopropane fatty-acyl-phospholipid synthase-like methyltransferase
MAQDYRTASLDIWEQMATAWDADRSWVWESSRPVGEWLVEALDPQPGESVLELAAGVGDTGMAVASRLGLSGKLISTDFSAQMVDAARRSSARRTSSSGRWTPSGWTCRTTASTAWSAAGATC